MQILMRWRLEWNGVVL